MDTRGLSAGRESLSDTTHSQITHMKTSSVISLILIVLALASVGCSASGRINVQNTPATKMSADTQIAYVSKLAPAPR